MKLYGIRINKTGRYITWCDEHWYETSDEPFYGFSHEDAVAIAKQLKSHYVYDVTLVDNDNNEERICKAAKNNPMKEIATVKKSFFRKF